MRSELAGYCHQAVAHLNGEGRGERTIALTGLVTHYSNGTLQPQLCVTTATHPLIQPIREGGREGDKVREEGEGGGRVIGS